MRAFATVLLQAGLTASAQELAWKQTGRYLPPDFESFFPVNDEAGVRLAGAVRSNLLEQLPPQEVLTLVREGLRTTKVHHLPVLRSFGNRFIWNKTPQDPHAIELMYHAAGAGTNFLHESTAYHAVYFGLSVTQPKTPNILRTLVDLCMASEDPNLLSRLAWGVRNQREEALTFLEPHLARQSTRDKAQLVGQILRGEVKAFAWATERAREKAERERKDDLPRIHQVLSEGSSEERKQQLNEIIGQRLALIMDDSFLRAFAQCASDPDPRVRRLAAIIVGENWIWYAGEENPRAAQLLVFLTRDPDHEVRYAAVYHGLSRVKEKDENLIRLLVEMALREEDPNLRHIIGWGLKNHQEITERIMAEQLQKITATAQTLRNDWFGEKR